jgi:3'-5' exoribonuclease
MARRYIAQIGEGESIDEIFLASEKQLRTNRNGNLYLQLRLSDRTGSLTSMLWNANERLYGGFNNGDYLRVQGTTQLYNGMIQMIANRIDRVAPDSVDENDFITLGTREIEQLVGRVREMLQQIKNYPLRNLAECFLTDDSFMQQFTAAPAGIKNHHAYRGGLLQHVVNVMELARLVAPRYPELDGDLLLMGAFLHDIGKLRELTYDRELSYTDEGQLVGHLVIAVELLNEKLTAVQKMADEEFPAELAVRLKHMLLSHHGQLDFGSPKVPMTTEAVALHYIDSLDSKLHTFQQLISEDVNSDSNWTTYHPSLGRKIYKGR